MEALTQIHWNMNWIINIYIYKLSAIPNGVRYDTRPLNYLKGYHELKKCQWLWTWNKYRCLEIKLNNDSY